MGSPVKNNIKKFLVSPNVVTNGKIDPQKAIKDKMFMRLYGKRDSGQFDKEGKSMTWNEYKNFNGPTFSSQEEASQAVDRRYSYATGETDANRAGLMGNRKRANIFGN